MTSAVQTHTNTDNAQFRHAILHFISTLEHLVQDLYKYGLKSTIGLNLPMLPGVRLPLPQNPNPRQLSYEGVRGIVSRFQERLAECEAILAKIASPDVRVPLHVGMIDFDLKGNGDAHPLWRLYAGAARDKRITESDAKNFYIKFDRGDVHWLRGYCHLLMGVCDVYLAHNTRDTFNLSAQLLFESVATPFPFLVKHPSPLLDLIALVHSICWEVAEPQRMQSALQHFEMVPAQSKESWKWIMAETEDDHEWLPNPRQTAIFPDTKVTDDMVHTWLDLMDQGARLLAGEELIPFWRGDGTQGINLRRVFTEPRTLDLVLWAQGTAAVAYLERDKPIIDAAHARAVEQAFRGRLLLFSIWFN